MSVELPSGKSIFAVWAPDSDAPGTQELRMKVAPDHGARIAADPTNRKLTLIFSIFLTEGRNI